MIDLSPHPFRLSEEVQSTQPRELGKPSLRALPQWEGILDASFRLSV